MTPIEFTDSTGNRYRRINKSAARRLWGKVTINICPVNLRPGFPWNVGLTCPVGFDKDAEFDSFVRLHTHLNCTNAETGLYPAFYVVS
jgi:hypothetical protein